MRINELILTKADKGNTLIVLTQEEFKQKKTFMQDNQFIIINKNPTQYYQKRNKADTKTLRECNTKRERMEIHKHESYCRESTHDNKVA
jgi:hypothetical protein